MAQGGKRPGAGRPKGTPNKATADVRAMAQKYGPSALATLSEIMEDTGAPEAARVAASKELLDRAYGKSKQAVEHSGQSDKPLVVVLNDGDDDDEN